MLLQAIFGAAAVQDPLRARRLHQAANGLGRKEEAVAARRELDELPSRDPRFAALEARLAAVSKGGAPKDNAERLVLGQWAYDTKRFATAARFWAEAVATDPKIASDRQAQHRYSAACAAALAAAGRGKDESPPDEATRARLRELARKWLSAELAIWK